MISRFGDRLKGNQKQSAEAEYEVEFDDELIRLKNPDDSVEEVKWDELKGFDVETNALGPFAPDLFWVLYGDGRGCVIPQGATGCEKLLEKLQDLPGFNNDAFIAAMSSTTDASFEIWRREGEQGVGEKAPG